MVIEEVNNNVNMNVEVQIPVLQAPVENFLHFEIPEDDLMDLEEGDQQDMDQGQQEPVEGIQLVLIQEHHVQGEGQLGLFQEQQDQGEGNQQNLVQGHQEQDGDLLFQNNQQIGMVRTFFINPPELTRQQETFWLAPNAKQAGPVDKTLIEVPTEWLGFFKALLLAPAQHCWAKQLLKSNFASLLHMETDEVASVSLNCKSSPTEACELLANELATMNELEDATSEEPMENSEEPMEAVSPGKKRGWRARADIPIVDSVVRRSTRVRDSCKGFKMSTCKTKNCLGCSSKPPTLSPATLKKIGTCLCQLAEEQLEEQALLNKKKMEPVGKKLKKDVEDKKKDQEDKDENN